MKKKARYSTYLHRVVLEDGRLKCTGRRTTTLLMVLAFLAALIGFGFYFLEQGKTPVFVFFGIGVSILVCLYALWDVSGSVSTLEYDINSRFIKAHKRKRGAEFMFEGVVRRENLWIHKRNTHKTNHSIGKDGLTQEPDCTLDLAFKAAEQTVYFPLSNLTKRKGHGLEEAIEEWERKLLLK